MRLITSLKLVWNSWNFSISKNLVYMAFISIVSSTMLIMPLLPSNTNIWGRAAYNGARCQYIGFSDRQLADATIVNSLQVGSALVNSGSDFVTIFSMLKEHPKYTFFTPERLIAGRYPQAPGEIAVSWSLVRLFNLSTSRNITVQYGPETNAKRVKVVGIIQPLVFDRYNGNKFLISYGNLFDSQLIDNIYFFEGKPKINDIMLINLKDIAPISFISIFPRSRSGEAFIMWLLLATAAIFLLWQVKSVADEGGDDRHTLRMLGFQSKLIKTCQFLNMFLTLTASTLLATFCFYFFAMFIFSEQISALLLIYFFLLVEGFLLLCNIFMVMLGGIRGNLQSSR